MDIRKTVIPFAAALLVACGISQEPASSESAPAPAAIDPAPAVSSGLSEYELLEQAAFNGDYQAQRNLAYTLATGIPHNPILACAWRIVIVESGAMQVDQSDIGNKAADCDRKLDADGITAARAQAKSLQEQIDARSAILEAPPAS